MMSPVRCRATRHLRVVAAAMLATVIIFPPAPFDTLRAQPVQPTTPSDSGRARATVEASSTAIPPDGTFGYTASLRLPEPVSYIQARLKLFRPSGRLVYQKTFVRSDVPSGTVSFSWSRDIGDVDLSPDAYPVEVSLVVERDGRIERQEIETELRVYDADEPRIPIAVVVRVEAEPMSDPDGRFVIDPARATAARRAVEDLSAMVLQDARLRVSLAIAPLTLDEWRRISEGYETAGSAGDDEVPEGADVPEAYRSALESLSRAARTGRLEILDVPYADPNPYELLEAGRIGDLRPHYSLGASALFRAIDTTPSAGSALAGGCVPSSSIPLLEGSDLDYVVVEPGCTMSEDSTASSGVYEIAGSSLAAAVSDPPAAAAIGAGEATRSVSTAFERQIGETEGSAQITVVPLGEGHEGTADDVRTFLEEVATSPWARLATVGSLAQSENAGRIELREHDSSSDAPEGFWSDVIEGRVHARALENALSTSDPQVLASIDNSLIAESSSWAGPDGSWALAERGRSFANSATEIAQDVLGAVTIEAVDITLSSARGSVPVSITNGGDKPLKVVVRAEASRFEVLGPTERPIELPPQETILDIPVDLQSALSGRLVIEVTSGSLVLDRAVARVNASVLDRLAAIGLILVVLLLALFFIIRRVRAAEAAEGGEPDVQ